ncbi:hypothetical protein SLE2022_250740 [Rubroshorea leprosula]
MLATGELSLETSSEYDRTKELKAFDDTKTGVKGLVDAGIVSIPKIFIRSPEELAEELNSCHGDIKVPVIDLSNIHSSDRRKEIVDEIRVASGEWGFFQVINHEIPLGVLDEMIDGTRRFHEQDEEVKKEFYTRDQMKKVRCETNYDLFLSRSANWRDTLNITELISDNIDPGELPAACSKSSVEYIKCIRKLGNTLLELLSEALGLQADHLGSMECGKSCNLVCHYYPACPEPELTLGASSHTDPSFFTLLLQDQIGGLQVYHEGQWVNVNPIRGGVIVNIGDYLQMVSNDIFKSVAHRVTANHNGPRISVACFFLGDGGMDEKPFGPIKELISESSPPRYKEFLVREFMIKFYSRSLDKSGLDYYKI